MFSSLELSPNTNASRGNICSVIATYSLVDVYIMRIYISRRLGWFEAHNLLEIYFY